MTMTKKLASLFAALVLATSMAACNKDKGSGNVPTAECDVDDQQEFDTDCGHLDDNGNWIWYPWVVLGQSASGPAPYAEAETKGEESGSKHKPKKKVSKAPKTNSAPKVETKKTKAPAPKPAKRS
jgi:hypothetical protein